MKVGGSPYRITFDLHRAFGLWTWALLLTIAFTGFSLNLYRELFLPILSTVSRVTPSLYLECIPTDPASPIVPTLDAAAVIDAATAAGMTRGWTAPVGSLGYMRRYGVYAARFFAPGDDHGTAGVVPATLYYDALDGRLFGDTQPWVGTAADIFLQAQFPLHSGRILGLPGRIMISIRGIVVALLSVTGVVIWWRKRAARVAVSRRAPSSRPIVFSPAE